MKTPVLYEPCAHCPFRSDKPGFLTKARARELMRELRDGKDFPCHKTLDYDVDGEDDDDDVAPSLTKRTATCAGFAIMCELENSPSQMMRIAERMGMYDKKKLNMKAPVHRNAASFIKAQRR